MRLGFRRRGVVRDGLRMSSLRLNHGAHLLRTMGHRPSRAFVVGDRRGEAKFDIASKCPPSSEAFENEARRIHGSRLVLASRTVRGKTEAIARQELRTAKEPP